MTTGAGRFTLTSSSRIAVRGNRAALAVARDLARYLRPATGYRLPVLAGQGARGDISLTLARRDAVPKDPDGEGYRLLVTPAGVKLAAGTAHGLYNGVQTIRQLLPIWIESHSRRPGPWTIPAVRIVDYPRYVYRGLMLDIARHYESPGAAERLIAQAAAYKIDVFHLHLSDDQGFRLVIKGFPRLAKVGGRGSVGTHGRRMDRGGFWTQAQYRAVVADARAHFMTLIPEVDSPGHTNAILMSEYYDVHNPRLHHPHSIDCGKRKPPRWNYTQAVGYSALCPGSSDTWTIMRAIIHQLAALTPGHYYDLGGDEVPHSLLSQPRYASFINKEARLVHGAGKRVMAWADAAARGTKLHGPSIAEYWNPASGSQKGTSTATEAVAKGMRVVMAPANHAYLDQKYRSGKAGNVPPTLGQNWACPRGCDVDRFYNWDPGDYVKGVTDRNVIGVEGAVWGETVVNLSQVDYMVFPRLIALAEVGWSPKAARVSRRSPAYRNFVRRLAAQGGRLLLAQTNFYPSPEVPWALELRGSKLRAEHHRKASGALATLAAPGRRASRIRATIKWGDGASSGGSVHGRRATSTRVNGLYSIAGSHTYAHPGRDVGTVIVRAPGARAVSAHFVVVVPK
jgi:hexosaminidase